MGVVLDFGTAVADGTTVVPVSFASNGESAVLPFTARSDTARESRPSPNPLYVYSDRIRVGTSEVACEAAEWGAGLDDVGLMDDTGVELYIQFRRYVGDGSDAVTLTDSVGMISSGFVTLSVTAHGISVAFGTASGAASNPTASHGVSVAAGAAIATMVGAASSHGLSVSLGTAIGTSVNPTASHGVSISLGSAAGEAASTALVSDNFDAETTASIPDNWTCCHAAGTAHFTVETGGLNSTAQCAKAAQAASNNPVLFRTFDAKTKIRYAARLKRGLGGTGYRYGIMTIESGAAGADPGNHVTSRTAGTTVASITLKDGNVQVTHAAAWVTCVAASANTEYSVEIVFDAAYDRFYVKIGSTYYWYDVNEALVDSGASAPTLSAEIGFKYTNTTAVSNVNCVVVDSYSPSVGGSVLFDEVTVEEVA